ncbi:MAG: hypothetical protein COV44_05355 [Deltaproteobacteria bacterium CG11_big_fil_rev_8_21_14_0_20_45_16]|nr:MAG: hypothetical protein COV44_05355 [Deltaproteobacteria bacterium CG11_big_fil_rev_8_21_14_0_20_45_16]
MGDSLASLRTKLILVVALITIVSFVSVLVSNLRLVKADKEESLRQSNRQVSELVAKFVISQIGEYRRGLNYIYDSWSENPEFALQAEYFPDYAWVTIVDWTGKPVFEWENTKALQKSGISSHKLLGKRNKDSLFSEVRQVLSKSDDWLFFNSTVDPLMPTFLLGSEVSSETDDIRYVALAEIFADSLYKQVQSRDGQELMLIDSHQNLLLSTREGWDPSKIILSDDQTLEIVKALNVGEERLELIEPLQMEEQLSYMKKFKAGQGLTLILQEPYKNLTAGHKKIQWQSGIVGLIVLIFVINVIIFMAHRFTSPLRKLSDLMTLVGKGEFSGRVDVKSNDEVGKLAKGFNRMLHDLSERDGELNRAKQKLIQSEKMSAFGQMSAGIAHEVKNPLAGILGYAQMAKKKLEDRPEVFNYMEIIEKETTRCKEIVENLMRFARQEKANLQKIDINKAVQDSVRLVEHQITVSGIKIVQVYALEGKPIFVNGNMNQIQQVMLNLMLNAQHAMESKGTLSVSTHFDEVHKQVMIMISDTGCGMSAEVQARIFEPFFTTKGVGKGTGLGLSVTIGIIKDHKGNIDVDSTEGKGTTFTISLPAFGADEGEAETEEKKTA